MSRECYICGRELAEDNVGQICLVCSDKARRDMVVDGSLHYGVKEIRLLLGLGSEESVRRLGRQGRIPGRVPEVKRHLYDKKIVDNWLVTGGKSPTARIMPASQITPTSPLQAEAYELCRKGDHSWLAEERFDGVAYSSEAAPRAEGYMIRSGHRRTCYFCKLALEIPM